MDLGIVSFCLLELKLLDTTHSYSAGNSGVMIGRQAEHKTWGAAEGERAPEWSWGETSHPLVPSLPHTLHLPCSGYSSDVSLILSDF